MPPIPSAHGTNVATDLFLSMSNTTLIVALVSLPARLWIDRFINQNTATTDPDENNRGGPYNRTLQLKLKSRLGVLYAIRVPVILMLR